MPGFAFDPMLLPRMTYHLQKTFGDMTDVVIKDYDLVDTSYTVLPML
jgi:hypothetical protein